jgi:hypothetical protein
MIGCGDLGLGGQVGTPLDPRLLSFVFLVAIKGMVAMEGLICGSQ